MSKALRFLGNLFLSKNDKSEAFCRRTTNEQRTKYIQSTGQQIESLILVTFLCDTLYECTTFVDNLFALIFCFYSSRRRCLGTPRIFLFPSSSSSPSPSSSPSVRSARSLQKGHLVIFFPFFLCVCACSAQLSLQCSHLLVIVSIPYVWAENIVRNPTETYKAAFLYGYCLFNKILLGISTIFNQTKLVILS